MYHRHLFATAAVLALGPGAACSGSHASPTPGDAGVPDGGSPDTGSPDGAWTGGPPATEGIARVLLVSIDGFHAFDMERYLADNPSSTLARLAAVGVRYTNARAPFPSDSFPSVLAWATGGTPRSTGVFYDISYDRKLSPPMSDCSTLGTAVDFSDAADINNSLPDGGGGLALDSLPRDPNRGCAVVYPHDYLRVNTIFEVVKSAGHRTAWSDKHLSYEVMLGPSGSGIDDLFDPEVAAYSSGSLYDSRKVDAIVNEIHGKDHTGAPASVPTLFGMNFQAVSIAQKANGYTDASGTPTDVLKGAMDSVDVSLGRLVDELNAAGLWSTTLFVVAASHGQSPVDPALLKRLPTSLIPGLANEVSPNVVAAATQDSVALLWLKDQSQTAAVAQHLLDNKTAAGIDHLVTGAELIASYGDPTVDSRIPDIIVAAADGTIYTDSKKKVGEHGGFSDDDRKVALLVVGGTASAATVSDDVETRQIAPTVLAALHLDPNLLQAVVSEETPPLPGVSFAP